ncbi:MAG: serine kinase, partial [Phyllobacteriaceae bacterium]|nr:serine kinase [Phyllobacteriaceae bacterium]
MRDGATIHASAVLYEGRGVLVRGASGAGKSRLVFDLVDEAATRGLDAALVADDRVE